MVYGEREPQSNQFLRSYKQLLRETTIGLQTYCSSFYIILHIAMQELIYYN